MRLAERFGGWSLPPGDFVWFHGASLGEMNGLLPLMRRWKRAYPEIPILATATSTTGLERARGAADEMRLIPFDSGVFIRRAIGERRIVGFIFGETEIWPGIIGELKKRGVPLFMVNARIGERSLRRYRRFRSLFADTFRSLTGVFASSEVDRARLVEVGVESSRCRTVGNAKYDLELSAATEEERRELRCTLSPQGGAILVLGSLRPGEERVWFPVLRALRNSSATVVVAPRHPEKFDLFAEALTGAQLSFRRWSNGTGSSNPGGLSVILLDTLGDLRRFYGAADLAFVGGSLVDWGGHNPLEPALLGVPIATGPYMSSVEEVTAALDAAEARIVVSNEEEVRALLDRVLRRDPALFEAGARGCEVARRFTGVADTIFERIQRGLEEVGGHGGS
jgi:3-deoxy-D-manno-octulosonic-acid transferase